MVCLATLRMNFSVFKSTVEAHEFDVVKVENSKESWEKMGKRLKCIENRGIRLESLKICKEPFLTLEVVSYAGGAVSIPVEERIYFSFLGFLWTFNDSIWISRIFKFILTFYQIFFIIFSNKKKKKKSNQWEGQLFSVNHGVYRITGLWIIEPRLYI